MSCKVLQAISVILALGGAFMLAFGLRVRTGISDDLRKQLHIEERNLISPSDVRQRTGLTTCGLVIIILAAVFQLWAIVCS